MSVRRGHLLTVAREPSKRGGIEHATRGCWPLVEFPGLDENMGCTDRKFKSTDYTEKHAEVFSARYDDGMRSIKVDRVRRRLGHVRGKSVLDLGCGIGYLASICVDLGANVVACDFAETMVARTQQRYASRFPLIRASAESPPFRPQSFDVVLALDVIEHLYHPTEMLDATWTLLRPEGRLIITTDRPGFELGALPGRVVRGVSGLLSRRSRRGRTGRRPTK